MSEANSTAPNSPTQVSTSSPEAAAQAQANQSTQPSEAAPKPEAQTQSVPAGSEGEKPTAEAQTSNESDKNADPAKGTEDATDKQPAEIADFAVPEGVSLDPDATTELKSLAKELGLKQEGAQKIADLGVKLSQKWEEGFKQAFEKQKSEWKESLTKDSEFGGEKLQENMAVVAKARDAFASPEFVKYLNDSGLGNHPEMVRMFYRVGKQISEDKLVLGAGNSPMLSQDYATRLYPNN